MGKETEELPIVVVHPSSIFEPFIESNEDFVSYTERFDCYTEYCQITNKVSFFIASVGAKTYQLLIKLAAPSKPKDLTYDKIIKLLTDHYCPAPLTDVCINKFRARKQLEHESFNDFYAALKQLAIGCKYATVARLNEELRAQIISGIRDSTVQAHYLSANLTLQEVIDKAVASENAKKGVEELRKSETPSVSAPVPTLNKVSEFERKKKRPKYKKPAQADKPSATSDNVVCYRCGIRDHKAPNCRHKGAKCTKCQKIGHLATVCGMGRRALHSAAAKSIDVVDMKSGEIVDIVLSAAESTIDATAENSPPPKIHVDVRIEGVPIRLEADCGATFTLISMSEFKRLGIKTPLRPSRYTLRIYDKSLVKIAGYVPVRVEYDGKEYKLILRVVHGDYDSVIGRDWIFPMQLDIRQLNAEIAPIHKIDIDLNAEIDKLVSEFADIFGDSPGRLPGEPVSFKLCADANPIFCRARSVPYALRDAVNEEIDRLVREKIYTPTETSEWATPIVPVVKSNGSVRLTGDYSVTLNKYIIPEEYQIPNSEEMLMELEGILFAKYDIVEAYMHMGVTAECAKLLAVNTPKGVHLVNCLNYGIQCAPSKFQRRLEEIIRKIPGFKNFFDDIRQASKTPEEHLQRMRMFFEVCRTNNLRLNKQKCVFVTDKLNYLGYTIDANGLHKTTEKVDLILNIPQPTNLDELQSFIGLVGYYSKFIPNFSDIAHPLNQLRRKNVPFVWSNACKMAFCKLKEEIASDRVLCHYNPAKELILSTDASPFALGAVLSHRFAEGERPIAFVSRTLTETESRYSQLDKEALAIYWGMKKFFNYLYGRPFTLITDCKPLLSIFAPSAAKPALSANRLLHYALFLQGFNYKVIYRRSSEHINADFASRHPHQIANASQIDVPTWSHINTINVLPVNAEMIAEATLLEPSSASLIAQLRGEERCTLKPSELAQYSLHGNCIMKNDRVYIPASLRKPVLAELHRGHCGIVRCKQLARSYVYWPKIDRDIEEMVSACPTCVKKDPPKEPFHPWQNPNAPWLRIHADIGQVGNTYLLVIVDASSKWPEGYVLHSTTSQRIIACFEDTFARFGLPATLVTDNGPQFAATEFAEFVRRNGINHVFSPPYCPYSNGQAERFIQIVKRGIAADQVGSMEERLQRVLFAYRRNKCSSTGKSPAAAMLGRELRTHLDLVKPTNAPETSTIPARRSFNVNEKVQLRMYNNRQKWINGVVLQKLGEVVYLVKDESNQTHKRHINQLRRAAVPKANPIPISIFSDPASRSNENIPAPRTPQSAPRTPPPAPMRRSERERRAPLRYSP
ncbi:uncharacterized protein K02A2.6-like [Planococcus citri]|uniref:uncharacterized protein K02A2.6-like n=1 Tax=Planococcus citri TaxID=170843 RepID=UPI0031F779D7